MALGVPAKGGGWMESGGADMEKARIAGLFTSSYCKNYFL